MTDKSEYRILVVSDTHGDTRRLNQVIRQEYPFDALLHCGDAQCDLGAELYNRDFYEVHAVKGNCDMFSQFPEAAILRFGSHKVYLTHGHRHDVDASLMRLSFAVREEGGDVAVFGHTHRPLKLTERGILYLNPGSLCLPRQYPREGTYAMLYLSEGKAPVAQIKTFFKFEGRRR